MTRPDRLETDREMLDLVGAMLNGSATEGERRRLSDLLSRDPGARRTYRRYMNLHAALRLQLRSFSPGEDLARDGAALQASALDPGEKRTTLARSVRSALAIAGSAAAILLVVSLLTRDFSSNEDAGGPPSGIARIARSTGARWADDSRSVAVGTLVGAGPLELTHGFVELDLGPDATALLQAPVRMELLGRRRIALRFGRLVVRAGRAQGEFVVDTPETRVTDLGTEFGVGVGPSGDTQVQVYEGRVVTEWKAPSGQASGRRQLEAGQAIHVGRQADAAEPLAFSLDRFVRTFPVIEGETAGGPIYNRSRFDTIRVMPATRPVTVDGSLVEWDLGGQFRSACTEPYDKAYHAQGAMMYDESFLYIGAHVGDPAPMRNMRDVHIDPQLVWQGGSIVVRLSTDPALGWPLLEDHGYAADVKAAQTDSIVHLMMWYDAKAEQSRLSLQYGLDFHGQTFDAPGWNGAFRRDADGAGYSMEYAIPWTLLHPRPAPPRGGEVTAACWIVHWSDSGGKIGRGYLVEITNPAEPKYDLMIGRTWGKAVFHAQGR